MLGWKNGNDTVGEICRLIKAKNPRLSEIVPEDITSVETVSSATDSSTIVFKCAIKGYRGTVNVSYDITPYGDPIGSYWGTIYHSDPDNGAAVTFTRLDLFKSLAKHMGVNFSGSNLANPTSEVTLNKRTATDVVFEFTSKGIIERAPGNTLTGKFMLPESTVLSEIVIPNRTHEMYFNYRSVDPEDTVGFNYITFEENVSNPWVFKNSMLYSKDRYSTYPSATTGASVLFGFTATKAALDEATALIAANVDGTMPIFTRDVNAFLESRGFNGLVEDIKYIPDTVFVINCVDDTATPAGTDITTHSKAIVFANASAFPYVQENSNVTKYSKTLADAAFKTNSEQFNETGVVASRYYGKQVYPCANV